ncbi:glycosyltransferase [Halopseudomonas oceani]|uniref:glycosyltransferase n=1 Tax=Halopseudomonas oceani TaxID=1708783 RepID=UPI002AA89128|nr:glycosyltransferase [Halopseudomonas oceani]
MSILPNLSEAGYTSYIVSRTLDPNARSLIDERIKFCLLGGGRLAFLFKLFFLLRKEQCDVIISSANDIGCFALLLRGLFFSSSKVVWSQHLSISGPLKASRGFKRARLVLERWLMRRLLLRADAVIAVSAAVAEDISHSVVAHPNLQVIHNPVVSDGFAERCGAEVEWPWPDYSVPTVIFVGRLAPVKRVDLLIEAFSKVKSSMAARLLILGEGPEASKLKLLAREHGLTGVCSFVGHQDDALPWIQRSDLLVLCSESEGFGLVLVEAMACGVQVVSTDCPDGPSEVLAGGRFGRLVPTNDVGSLAQAIEQSLNAPLVDREELQTRAADFSVERAVSQYLEVLEAVVRQ